MKDALTMYPESSKMPIRKNRMNIWGTKTTTPSKPPINPWVIKFVTMPVGSSCSTILVSCRKPNSIHSMGFAAKLKTP